MKRFWTLFVLVIAVSVFAQGMGKYDIYQNGGKVGEASFQLVRQGNAMILSASATVESGGKKTDYTEEGLFDNEYRPQSYKFTRQEPTALSIVTAEFIGGKIGITSSAGVQKVEKNIDFPPDGMIFCRYAPSNLWILAHKLDFEFIGSVRVSVFLPAKLDVVDMSLSKKGEEKLDGSRAYRIEGSVGDVKFVMSVRKDDRIPVKIEYPGTGLELRLVEKPAWADEKKATPASASTEMKGFAPLTASMMNDSDLLMRIEKIKGLESDISFNASEAMKRLYLNHRGQEFVGVFSESGDVQGHIKVKKKHYQVTGCPDWPLPEPLRGYNETYLLPERGVDSDDPAIKDRAERVVAPTRTLWDAARAVNLWVYRNIKYSDDFFGAKEAFVNLKGNSRSKALLVVSMCRAVGIPARIVSGFIYADGPVDHCWVEVYNGENVGWGPLDPTLNEADDISGTHTSLFLGTPLPPVSVKDIKIENLIIR